MIQKEYKKKKKINKLFMVGKFYSSLSLNSVLFSIKIKVIRFNFMYQIVFFQFNFIFVFLKLSNEILFSLVNSRRLSNSS